MQPLYLNTTAPDKPRVNLSEAKEVTRFVLAYDPKTEPELDAALSTARVVGTAAGKCYQDETRWLRARLYDALILPRLCVRRSMQLA